MECGGGGAGAVLRAAARPAGGDPAAGAAADARGPPHRRPVPALHRRVGAGPERHRPPGRRRHGRAADHGQHRAADLHRRLGGRGPCRAVLPDPGRGGLPGAGRALGALVRAGLPGGAGFVPVDHHPDLRGDQLDVGAHGRAEQAHAVLGAVRPQRAEREGDPRLRPDRLAGGALPRGGHGAGRTDPAGAVAGAGLHLAAAAGRGRRAVPRARGHRLQQRAAGGGHRAERDRADRGARAGPDRHRRLLRRARPADRADRRRTPPRARPRPPGGTPRPRPRPRPRAPATAATLAAAPLRAAGLRLPERRPARAPRPQPGGALRGGAGGRRTERRRQDHADQAARPLAGTGCRADHRRRDGHHPLAGRPVAPLARPGEPGVPAAGPVGPGERRDRRAGAARRRRLLRRRGGRARPGRHRGRAAGRLAHPAVPLPHRGHRPVRRPVAADSPGTRDLRAARGPRRPDAGRADRAPGRTGRVRGLRAPDHRGPRRDGHPHLAPAVHRAAGRPDRRAERWPDHRTGHPRRAGGRGRRLRAAVRPAGPAVHRRRTARRRHAAAGSRPAAARRRHAAAGSRRADAGVPR